jgi:hypothetical protein
MGTSNAHRSLTGRIGRDPARSCRFDATNNEDGTYGTARRRMRYISPICPIVPFVELRQRTAHSRNFTTQSQSDSRNIQVLFFSNLAKLLKGSGFQLANSFFRNSEFLTDLFQRLWRLSVLQAISPYDDVAFPWIQL